MTCFITIIETESKRNTKEGSWFITDLCDKLDNRKIDCCDLLELMPKVIDKVVDRQQEYTNQDNKKTEYCAQTPEIVSFLHRSVILP